jgi:hypothetical protein
MKHEPGAAGDASLRTATGAAIASSSDVSAGLSICAAAPKLELRLWFLAGKTARKFGHISQRNQPAGQKNNETQPRSAGGARAPPTTAVY